MSPKGDIGYHIEIIRVVGVWTESCQSSCYHAGRRLTEVFSVAQVSGRMKSCSSAAILSAKCFRLL